MFCWYFLFTFPIEFFIPSWSFSFFLLSLCLGEIGSVYKSARVTPENSDFSFSFDLTVFVIRMLCCVLWFRGVKSCRSATLWYYVWRKLKGNSCTEFNIYDKFSIICILVFIMTVNVYHSESETLPPSFSLRRSLIGRVSRIIFHLFYARLLIIIRIEMENYYY